MAVKQDIAQVVAALQAGKARESELLLATGWDAAHLATVLAAAQKCMLVKPAGTRPSADTCWILVAHVIAQCPWKPAKVMAALGQKERTTRELAKMAGGSEEAMRLMLLRMCAKKQIKQVAFKGLRKWVPYARPDNSNGPLPDASPEVILALIREHQPVQLELLAELVGRGRIHTREQVHKLRRQGLVKIVGKDGSWTYAMPDYEPGPKEVGREILLRCEEVGGDCLTWSGAHSEQGHALVRHDGNIRPVDGGAREEAYAGPHPCTHMRNAWLLQPRPSRAGDAQRGHATRICCQERELATGTWPQGVGRHAREEGRSHA